MPRPPPVLSRHCALAPALALLVLALCLGQVAAAPFHLGHAIITQSALRDAPERYAQRILSAITQAAQNFKVPSCTGGSCDFSKKWSFDGSHANIVFDLNVDTLNITIVPGGFAITADAVLTINNAGVDVQACAGIGGWCMFCFGVCSGNVQFISDLQLSANVTLSSQPPFTVKVPVTLTPTGSPTATGCALSHFGDFLNIFTNVQSDVTAAIVQAIQTAVANTVASFAVPNVFQPTTNVSVSFASAAYTFVSGSNGYVLMALAGNVTAIDPVNGTTVSFAPDSCQASADPPTDWDFTTDGGQNYLLGGIRASSTAMVGLLWACDTAGAFNMSANAQILDANLSSLFYWSQPGILVFTPDVVNVTIGHGQVLVQCEASSGSGGRSANTTASDSSDGQNNDDQGLASANGTVTMINLDSSNLVGNGTVVFTGSAKPGAYLQINSIDVVHANISLLAPRIPLPASFVLQVMEQTVEKAIPQLNKFLAEYAAYLPDYVPQYLPNSDMHVFPQNISCDPRHGYLQFASYCRAQGAGPANQSSQWIPCQRLKPLPPGVRLGSHLPLAPMLTTRQLGSPKPFTALQVSGPPDPPAAGVAWTSSPAARSYLRRDASSLGDCSGLQSRQEFVSRSAFLLPVSETVTAKVLWITEDTAVIQEVVSNHTIGFLSPTAEDVAQGPHSTDKWRSAPIASSPLPLSPPPPAPPTPPTPPTPPPALPAPLLVYDNNCGRPDDNGRVIVFEAAPTNASCNISALGPYSLGSIDVNGTWHSLTLICPLDPCAPSCQFYNTTVPGDGTCMKSKDFSLQRDDAALHCLATISFLNSTANHTFQAEGSESTILETFPSAMASTVCNSAVAPNISNSTAWPVTGHTFQRLAGAVDGQCRQARAADGVFYWRAAFNATTSTWSYASACTDSTCSSCQITGRHNGTWACIPLNNNSTVVFRNDTAFDSCLAALPKSDHKGYVLWRSLGIGLAVTFVTLVLVALAFAVYAPPHLKRRALPKALAELFEAGPEPDAAEARAVSLTPTIPCSCSWDKKLWRLLQAGVWALPVVSRRMSLWLATAGGLILAVSWLAQSPFDSFTVELLQRLGLDTNLVDPSGEQLFFHSWTVFGSVVLPSAAVVLFYATIGRKGPSLWRLQGLDAVPLPWTLRHFLLLTAVMVGFVLLIVPPFGAPLDRAFQVRCSNDSFAQSNAQARSDLDALLGNSFIGFLFAFMAKLWLFQLLGILPGVYLAVCGVVDACASRRHCIAISTMRRVFLFLRITACVALFVCPVAALMHMIILYQSLMLPLWALFAWALNAMVPFFLFAHLARVMDKVAIELWPASGRGAVGLEGLRSDRADMAWRSLRFRLWLNGAITVGVMVITTPLLLQAVRSVHILSVAYPAVLWIATALEVYGLTFASLVPRHVAQAVLGRASQFVDAPGVVRLIQRLADGFESGEQDFALVSESGPGDILAHSTTITDDKAVRDAMAPDDSVNVSAAVGDATIIDDGPMVSTSTCPAVSAEAASANQPRPLESGRQLMPSDPAFSIQADPLVVGQAGSLANTAEGESDALLLQPPHRKNGWWTRTKTWTAAKLGGRKWGADGVEPPVLIRRALPEKGALAVAHRSYGKLVARTRRLLSYVKELILEREEARQWQKYGRRLPYRRIWLVIGFAAYTYLVFEQLHDLRTETVEQEVQAAFSAMGYNVTWPAGANGTIFDQAFAEYRRASWTGWGLLSTGWLLLLAAVVAACIRSSRGLFYSRAIGYASLLVLFMGVLWPALPNYLKASHVDEIFPHCAPKFDNALDQALGSVIGVAIAGLFTLKLAPVTLAIIPAFVRAAKLMLEGHDVSADQSNSAALEAVMLAIIRYTPLLTPLLTALPLIVVCRLTGDPAVSVIVLLFWLLPPLVSLQITAAKPRLYYLLSVAYFGTLLMLLIYMALQHGLGGLIVDALQTADLYLELAAEIALANVVVSDCLYANM